MEEYLLPCSICNKPTVYRCSDCMIDWRLGIPVCESSECRDKHEQVKCSRAIR